MGRKGVGEGEESKRDKRGWGGVETPGGKGNAEGGERSQKRDGEEVGWDPGCVPMVCAAEPGAALSAAELGPFARPPPTAPLPLPSPAQAAALGRWEPKGCSALPASLARLGRRSAPSETEPWRGQPGAGWLARLGGVGPFYWR